MKLRSPNESLVLFRSVLSNISGPRAMNKIKPKTAYVCTALGHSHAYLLKDVSSRAESNLPVYYQTPVLRSALRRGCMEARQHFLSSYFVPCSHWIH